MIFNGITKLRKLKVKEGKSVEQKDDPKRGLKIKRNLVYDKWTMKIKTERIDYLNKWC